LATLKTVENVNKSIIKSYEVIRTSQCTLSTLAYYIKNTLISHLTPLEFQKRSQQYLSHCVQIFKKDTSLDTSLIEHENSIFAPGHSGYLETTCSLQFLYNLSDRTFIIPLPY